MGRDTQPSRRDFMATAAVVAGALTGAGAATRALKGQTPAAPKSEPAMTSTMTAPNPADVLLVGADATTRQGDMLYRTLGKTGERVSLIGLGGAHIGWQRDPQESVRIIRSAIDRGITFMDNCWDYSNGQSEVRMGDALKDGYRDKVFLMTKIDGRTKAAAAGQIDQSLQRLGTDRIDLLQLHEVIRMEDPFRAFRDGAIEALQAAQKAGKLRYIGFTGHKDPSVHLRMLDVAREHDFRFDAVQLPLNVLDAHFLSFAHRVLPRLVAEQIGVLGMKAFAAGAIVRTNTVQPMECLHYAMSLPTSVVITGIDSARILDQAIEAAKTFRPLDRGQMQTLLAKTAEAAQGGRHEMFKTSDRYDGTARHPGWLSSAQL